MNPKMRAHMLGRVLLLLAAVCSLVSAASAGWQEKVLYSFQGGANDGFFPAGGVVFDKQGNLYGATTGGGKATCAPFGSECGTVFQLSPPAQKGGSWTETVLYQFQGKGSNDGSVPNGGLIIDAAGNLYGVTAYGGTGYCLLLGANAGCGTVYELSPPQQPGGAWTETTLYSFATAKEGYLAIGNLVFDSAGNLYGATWFGGDKGTTCDSLYGGQCGVVFELSPPKTKGGEWTETVLHSFGGMEAGSGLSIGDGANPNGGLVFDSKGAIYGTTYTGGFECPHDSGQGCGAVFKLVPPAKKDGNWIETVVHRFHRDAADGGYPQTGVIVDSKGRVCGTTVNGGPGAYGTAFCLTPPSSESGSWNEAILYGFKDNNQYGADPVGGLSLDRNGNLYGTASVYGAYFGTAFELKPDGPDWGISLLYSFKGSPDARFPAASMVFDSTGNLYSTTEWGGTGQACQGGCGAVYEIAP
jgi:hypothetical protein